MSEAHLNALLDRYLKKYSPNPPPNTLISQTQTASTSAVAAPSSSAFNASSSSHISTIPPSSTQTQSFANTLRDEQKYDSVAPAPPTAASSFAQSTQPTQPQSSNFAATINSNNVTAPDPSKLTSPSALFRTNDLIMIQSQIQQLSQKLHRVPEKVVDTNYTTQVQPQTQQSANNTLNSTIQAQPTHQPTNSSLSTQSWNQYPSLQSTQIQTQPQPPPAASASQQLHLRDLDQSYSAGNAKPAPTPAPQQPQVQRHSEAVEEKQQQIQLQIQQQQLQLAEAQKSIAASMLALSPASKAAKLPTNPFTTIPPIPDFSPSSSPLKTRLTFVESQLQKQSLAVSEKEFALVNLERENTQLKLRLEKLKGEQKDFHSLRREHDQLRLSYERSEKIRREQLSYIQILHTQIQFLQNSNQQILAAGSPQKIKEVVTALMSPNKLASPNGTTTTSIPLPPQFESLEQGVSLTHIDAPTAVSSIPYFTQPPPPTQLQMITKDESEIQQLQAATKANAQILAQAQQQIAQSQAQTNDIIAREVQAQIKAQTEAWMAQQLKQQQLQLQQQQQEQQLQQAKHKQREQQREQQRDQQQQHQQQQSKPTPLVIPALPLPISRTEPNSPGSLVNHHIPMSAAQYAANRQTISQPLSATSTTFSEDVNDFYMETPISTAPSSQRNFERELDRTEQQQQLATKPSTKVLRASSSQKPLSPPTPTRSSVLRATATAASIRERPSSASSIKKSSSRPSSVASNASITSSGYGRVPVQVKPTRSTTNKPVTSNSHKPTRAAMALRTTKTNK